MNKVCRRRDVLAGAVAGAAVLAGCSGNDDGDAGGDGGDDGSNGHDDGNDATTVNSDGGNTDTEQQTETTTEQGGDVRYDGRYFKNLRTNENGSRVRFDIAGWPDQWSGGPIYGGNDRGPHPKDSRDGAGNFTINIHDYDTPVKSDADRGSVAPGIHTEDEVLAYLADTGLFGGEPEVGFVDMPADDDGSYEVRYDGPVQSDDVQRIDIERAEVTVGHIDPTEYVDPTSVNSPRFIASVRHPDASLRPGEAGYQHPIVNVFFEMP